MNRRTFVQTASCSLAATLLPKSNSRCSTASWQQDSERRRSIKKSVKWGMVGAGESVLEKFQIQKELGYDGVEFISPTQIDLNEVVAASKETKMPVHGLVNMKHWEIRMSSADEKQRREAVQIMKKCIKDVKHLGGDSVLLVPGQVTGKDETHDDVWKRSIECIRQVIPLAAENKIQILIENVWNGFCEKPQQLCDYIDEIDSEWVKVYFDIGNARKFAPSEEWIRMLGQRIIKLDVKDWGRENGFCKIGDGDVDWPAVCRELDALQFIGWSTAEVEGGGRDRLQDIASRMDRVLIE